MRYQRRKYACGAAAVVNTLRAFGVRVSEARIRKLAGTDETGTSSVGLVTALRAFGLSVQEYSDNNAANSWRWLHGNLIHGRPVIVCVDNWQHWVTAIGSLSDRVVLFDSVVTKRNASECGVHVLASARFMRKWRNGAASASCRYYGVSAGRL